jgi:hypothetical protein
VFICDFVTITKVDQGEIYALYMDMHTRFIINAFQGYKYLLNSKYELIIMCWVIDLNIHIEHWTFDMTVDAQMSGQPQ